MERRQNELEEGELEEDEVSALLFHYERNFDPDIDLSHIGEKVQLLLGHFQKDFEGGALTESLGPTHGGYGSFLPWYEYEQSPSDIPHARTTQIHQNNYIARYPYDSSVKRINQISVFRSCARQRNYSHAKILPANRGTTMNNSYRANVYLPSYKGTEDFATKPVTTYISDNSTEHHLTLSQKCEEVRKNVILDSLPSPLEEIQAKTNGLPLEIQQTPNESTISISENVSSFPAPGECFLSQKSDSFLCSSKKLTGNNFISDDSATSIAECMDSFPVSGNCLLSPLPDNLLQLTEKGNWESMASDDGSQAEKQMVEDSSGDKIHGGGAASFSEDTQVDWGEEGRINAGNRSGMKQCDISEEETSQTLFEFGQLRIPDRQNNLICHPDAPTSGPASSDEHPVALLHQDHNMNNLDVENEREYDSYQLPTPDLKNTLGCQPGTTASGPTSSDEQNLAQFHQDQSLVSLPNLGYQAENDSAADYAKQPGSCFKRLADEDSSRMSKRTKSASLYHANDNYSAENGGVTEDLGSNSSNGLLIEKDAQIYRENSSPKDSKSFWKENCDLLEKHMDGYDNSLDGDSTDLENSNSKNAPNGRKMELQETHSHSSESCSSGFPLLQDGEESNENEVSTEKEARVDEFTTRKGNENIVWQTPGEIHTNIGQTIFPADAYGYEQTVPKNRSPVKDFDARSTVIRNPSCQYIASEVIKEGNLIKDKAVNQENFCPTLKTTGLYFESALKFLRGALLLEPCSEQIAKFRDVTDSMFMNIEAATLFESAAEKYAKYNKMAAAALAYKCTEVALMRVAFEKRNRMDQDQKVLQRELRNAWLGNSPALSGSDVDNPYTDGERMARSHTIVVGNRAKFERVLNFTGDALKAFEAGRKSQKALEACMNDEQDPNDADIGLVKKAIDYSFSCVDDILSLAEDAVESLPDYGGY